jgi:hypothetical protein
VTYSLLKPLPLSQLATASKQRIDTSAYFTNTRKLITTGLTEVMIPQQWEAYVQWRIKQYENAEKRYEIPASLITVKSPAFDNKLYELDAHQLETNNQVIKQISKDAYIKEAVMILSDLLRLQ